MTTRQTLLVSVTGECNASKEHGKGYWAQTNDVDEVLASANVDSRITRIRSLISADHQRTGCRASLNFSSIQRPHDEAAARRIIPTEEV